ncbi:MAG: prepilin-type N-terminal cleavage/methylation domain-containing protein [Thioploca sp.]|nr:prepilin-type N-terminal cleavage/methylation domain-containing protein [Thioploca sp.]
MLTLLIGNQTVNKFTSAFAPKNRPLFQAGFTLLELIIVMAIIGMIASLVIPHIGSGQLTLLKAQMREVVAVLNYARRSAIVEGKQKVASFYEGKENTAEKSPQKMNPGQWVSRGTTLQWGEKTGEDQPPEKAEKGYQITFYPEGGSSGGEIILGYLEHKAVIRVNPLTGKVEAEIVDDKN